MKWVLTDAWTIAGRTFAHRIRRPGLVLVGLLFPVLVVLMFGYLFGGALEASIPGGDYFEFLMPGMFALAMLFGLEATMAAVATDKAKGITDRFRSLPMAGSAVVAGRAVADLAESLLGLAVLIVTGLLVGWSWHEGIGAALAAVGLLLLLRLALIWVGIYLGLIVKGPEAVVAVQILVWPFGFLSNAFVSPETMPGWLGTIAELNPMSATVAATRELFGNPGWGGDSWAAEHTGLLAIAWPLAILAVFVPLAIRRYRGLSDG